MPRVASPPSSGVHQLADRLHSAAIHLLRRVRREDDKSGLSAARLSALSVLVYGGPMRISSLARAEQVRTPTITPVVSALEQDGLVVRAADPSDGRAAIVKATARGARVMNEGRARRVALLASELERLPRAQQEVLRRAAIILEDLFKPR